MSPSSPAIASPRRTLLPVFAACAAIGLQAGIGIPLVPLALEQQGHDKLTIGIVSAAWAVGMLSFGTRIPALAARFGTVPAIVGGGAIAMIVVGVVVAKWRALAAMPPLSDLRPAE